MSKTYEFTPSEKERKSEEFLDCWEDCGEKGFMHKVLGRSVHGRRKKARKQLSDGTLHTVRTNNKKDYLCWLDCAEDIHELGSDRQNELFHMKMQVEQEEQAVRERQLQEKLTAMQEQQQDIDRALTVRHGGKKMRRKKCRKTRKRRRSRKRRRKSRRRTKRKRGRGRGAKRGRY